MPQDIAQRLLQDTKKCRRRLFIKRHFVWRIDQLALNAGAPVELGDLPFDSGGQAQVEYIGAQVVDNLAHALDRGVDVEQGGAGALVKARMVGARATGKHVGVDA